MRNSKIILVEGMPGTGKSSIAQLIQRQLSASGRESYWCHEERQAHPVRLFYEPKRHLTWTDYCHDALRRWENYAEELAAGDQMAVLDAAVLQNHARAMLLFGWEWPAIFELVHRIETILASIDPIWVYLKPVDIEQSFQNLARVRGQRLIDTWLSQQSRFPHAAKATAQGLAGFLAFWREFDTLSDRVFSKLTTTKLQQSISPIGWAARQRQLLDFLGLPLPAEPTGRPLLNRFCGEYRSANSSITTALKVTSTHDCLLMTCDDPSIDVLAGPIGCFREIRLLPMDRNRFQVEAWPHVVEFIENDAGIVVALQISAPEVGWSKAVESFERFLGSIHE